MKSYVYMLIVSTSGWTSFIISYMSRRTNNFSGDLLLLAMASPKLKSKETLVEVASAKHWSMKDFIPSKTSSDTFLSAANSSFTCFSYNKC